MKTENSPVIYIVILAVCVVLFFVLYFIQKRRGRKVISFNYLEEVEDKIKKQLNDEQ